MTTLEHFADKVRRVDQRAPIPVHHYGIRTDAGLWITDDKDTAVEFAKVAREAGPPFTFSYTNSDHEQVVISYDL